MKQLAQVAEEVGSLDFSGAGEGVSRPRHAEPWEEAAAAMQGLTCGEVVVVVALEERDYGWVVLEERTPFAPLGKAEAPQTEAGYHP